jgi:hypothetical protein
MLKNLETPSEKEVRRLVTLAHERGLTQGLEKLEVAFGEWRAGKITALALNDRIKSFHDGPATTLAKQFLPPNSMTALGHAVVAGLVKESEVPASLQDELAIVVSVLKFKK